MEILYYILIFMGGLAFGIFIISLLVMARLGSDDEKDNRIMGLLDAISEQERERTELENSLHLKTVTGEALEKKFWGLVQDNTKKDITISHYEEEVNKLNNLIATSKETA